MSDHANWQPLPPDGTWTYIPPSPFGLLLARVYSLSPAQRRVFQQRTSDAQVLACLRAHGRTMAIHLFGSVRVHRATPRMAQTRRRSSRRLAVQAKRTRYGLDPFGGHRYYVGWKRREILEIAVMTGGVD